MPAKLDLINRALAELGRLQVSNINESQDAQFISNKVDELLPVMLLDYPWNFAVQYREDSTPLVSNFSPDYEYAYQLPSDYGRFYMWATSGAQYPYYAILDNQLLADTKPIQYYYIVNFADYSVLPPLFCRAFVLYVAAESALIL